MSIKNKSIRLSIDIPKALHKKLKKISAENDVSLKQIVINALQLQISNECLYSHIPNEETIQAIKDSENEENLIRGTEAEKVSKKLGL